MPGPRILEWAVRLPCRDEYLRVFDINCPPQLIGGSFRFASSACLLGKQFEGFLHNHTQVFYPLFFLTRERSLNLLLVC